jgi:hypothetical protein
MSLSSASRVRTARALRSHFSLVQLATLALFLVASACGSKSPTGPSGTSLTGTWTGFFADSILGNIPTTWKIQQSGSTITGTFVAEAPLADGKGTLSGNISGTKLTGTGVIPTGGYPAPFQGCTQSASGTFDVSDTKITGTYKQTMGSGCTPPSITTTGTLTLTKQ